MSEHGAVVADADGLEFATRRRGAGGIINAGA